MQEEVKCSSLSLLLSHSLTLHYNRPTPLEWNHFSLSTILQDALPRTSAAPADEAQLGSSTSHLCMSGARREEGEGKGMMLARRRSGVVLYLYWRDPAEGCACLLLACYDGRGPTASPVAVRYMEKHLKALPKVNRRKTTPKILFYSFKSLSDMICGQNTEQRP